VAHDPRAPRLAAMATLAAAALLVASAANLQLNFIGAKGISGEELVAVSLAAVAIAVANLANKEREIPDLGQHREQNDIEDFEQTLTRTNTPSSTSINPTTASIISGILGETTSTEIETVQSAISTLSRGEFAANVDAVLKAPEQANQTTALLGEDNQKTTNINDAHRREANPTDETTGETLQRVLVKPVPLPGREDQPTVDPTNIPGLEPNRVFVREGVASVPLPVVTLAETPSGASSPELSGPHHPKPGADLPQSATTSPSAKYGEGASAPELPDLSELLNETKTASSVDDEGHASEAPTALPSGLPPPVLPDLDDLFEASAPPGTPSTTPPPAPAPAPAPSPSAAFETPALPNLDDLF
jgi:hypothetical protein